MPPFLLGGMTMALFKGFSQIDLLEREPRTLCAILAEQLALSNKAIEAQAEEIKQLRADEKHWQCLHGKPELVCKIKRPGGI